MSILRLVRPVWVLGIVLATASVTPTWGADEPQVVAEIDGRSVTMAELKSFAAAPLEELDRQRYQVLEAGLTQLIEQKLVELEAARRGLDVEGLLDAETKLRSKEVTDEDVDAWFAENEGRLKQPKEAIVDQVRPYLEHQQQQQARTELVKELRRQFRVTTHLQPRRSEVDLTNVPFKGPANAPVTLVEFSDFQCPYCQRINATLDDVRKTYGDQVRVAFMQFPLTSIHKQAFKAAEAALCADAQGQFWPMHDAIFAQPRNLTPDELKSRAATLGLDAETFATCLDGGASAPEVRRQMAVGRSAGVTGTPTFLVNGRLLELKGGIPAMTQIQAMVDDELGRLAE